MGSEITIDVIVVTSNSAPTVSVTQDLKDLTSAANGAGKLTSNSAKEVPFTAVITAGVSGEATETITFELSSVPLRVLLRILSRLWKLP